MAKATKKEKEEAQVLDPAEAKKKALEKIEDEYKNLIELITIR